LEKDVAASKSRLTEKQRKIEAPPGVEAVWSHRVYFISSFSYAYKIVNTGDYLTKFHVDAELYFLIFIIMASFLNWIKFPQGKFHCSAYFIL
jgi:hypothetical protein